MTGTGCGVWWGWEGGVEMDKIAKEQRKDCLLIFSAVYPNKNVIPHPGDCDLQSCIYSFTKTFKADRFFLSLYFDVTAV